MVDVKVQISTLWIVITLNMIFADIFSIIVDLRGGNLLQIPGRVETMMLIAVFLTNIPIMMIFLSRVLGYRNNCRLNIGAAILTIIYVVGGGVAAPHYIATAMIEVTVLMFIIRLAWQWNGHATASQT